MSPRSIRPTVACTAMVAFVGLGACSFGLPGSVEEWSASHAVDAGVDAPSLACGPKTPNGQFATPWKAPRAKSAACDSEKARALLDCLLFPSQQNAAGCQQRYITDKACRDCIYSTTSDAQLGPIIFASQDVAYPNLQGCVALLQGDLSATGCGAKMHLRDDCIAAACAACNSEAEVAQCSAMAIASGGPCATYKDQASCTAQYNAACGLDDFSANQALLVTTVFCLP